MQYTQIKFAVQSSHSYPPPPHFCAPRFITGTPPHPPVLPPPSPFSTPLSHLQLACALLTKPSPSRIKPRRIKNIFFQVVIYNRPKEKFNSVKKYILIVCLFISSCNDIFNFVKVKKRRNIDFEQFRHPSP